MIRNRQEWIASMRDVSLLPQTPIQQKDGKWEVADRRAAWNVLGPRVFDEHLDRFQKVAVDVLSERDPQFELDPDQRFAASVHGKALKHSPSLRKGLAETLALLGSFPEDLKSCSRGKAEATALLAVREILNDRGWVLWASINNHLPMLAEAAPNEFLESVERALSQTPCPFVDIYRQEGGGVMGRNYMTGLLWALETLAWHTDYLMRAVVLLGELAALDPGGNWSNRPSNSLADILLPWHPQTCAPIPKRKSAVAALIREQPIVGWKLLLALLPNAGAATSGTRKPSFREFIPMGWSEEVTGREYWEQIAGYAELALGAAAEEVSRLAELIGRLPDLPNPFHSEVLEHLVSDKLHGLSEFDRLPLWEALVDLASKHRKFADAQWVMREEAVTKIEETAKRLAPNSPSLLHRRLFSDRDFNLYEEKGNYEEQRQKLDVRRREGVREILTANQLDGVLDFAKEVAAPEKVGQALGSIECEAADSVLLPDYLDAGERCLSAFIHGFVWGRFRMKGWPWVDAVVASTWTAEQQATFFAFLPFERNAWSRAEQLLSDNAAIYWEKSRVNPWEAQEDLLEAVEKLLQHGRPLAALECLNWLVHKNASFPPELAVRALMNSVATEGASDARDPNNPIELIKWLQENLADNSDALFRVEWAYLPLLDGLHTGVPKTLERHMADDPTFFCKVIGIVFRSEKEKLTNREPGEHEIKIAENAYRLLRGWKIVPGGTADGSFDGAAFHRWLAEVKQRTRDSGHLRVAMSQLGKVLPYTPPDPSSLWIHRSVAEALNAKDAAEMRSGFTCELFNMRGVHGYSAGKEEQEIAARYHERAEALEQEGYHRLAAAVRELAKQYQRDAEREATQKPFES